jgi:hypothetical protein
MNVESVKLLIAEVLVKPILHHRQPKYSVPLLQPLPLSKLENPKTIEF